MIACTKITALCPICRRIDSSATRLKVLVEGLKRAGRTPSRASLIAGLESLQEYDLGGVKVTYGPQNHSGLTFVDASIVNRKGGFTQ